jgi:murein L,D-transpeptidase YafK
MSFPTDACHLTGHCALVVGCRGLGMKAMTLKSIAAALAVGCVASSACAKMHAVTPNAQWDNRAQPVDRVEVRKAQRELLLLHGNDIVRAYRVQLGRKPTGQKERSGDYRTPEGTYRLEHHNPHSHYFLSIQVSYPNQADLARARSHHWDAGGSIMIHGLPNALKHKREYYKRHDWTDGCIAVSNADMAEIWTLIPDNVRIDILP